MTVSAPASAGAHSRWAGPMLVLAGGICIGYAPIGVRLGTNLGDTGLGPQAIAFWRFVFACPLVFAITSLVHKRLPVRPNRFVFLAGTFFALDIALWHWALTLTTVANSTFIVNLGNIGVGLLAWAVLKERLTVNWLMAALIAMVGAGLLALAGGDAGKGDLRGDTLAFGAAILVSGYMLCAKIARQNLTALDVLFWVTVTEAVVAGLVTLASGERFLPATSAGWQAPLSLALVVQVLGQGLVIAGLGRTPAAIAGILVLIQPVIAASVSWQLFDETLRGAQIFGCVLILVGVGLAQTGRQTKKLS